MLDPTEYMETAEEQRVHRPPASLVPRLHMLYARPLPHNNPLLPLTTLEDNSACEDSFSPPFYVCVFMYKKILQKSWLITVIIMINRQK